MRYEAPAPLPDEATPKSVTISDSQPQIRRMRWL